MVLQLLNEVENILELNPHLSEEVSAPFHSWNRVQIKNSDIYLKKLKEGIFYDMNRFDQKYYKDLNLPLLNEKAEYYYVKDNLTLSFDEDMFIKPSRDMKAFDGVIIKANTNIEEYIKLQQYRHI